MSKKIYSLKLRTLDEQAHAIALEKQRELSVRHVPQRTKKQLFEIFDTFYGLYIEEPKAITCVGKMDGLFSPNFELLEYSYYFNNDTNFRKNIQAINEIYRLELDGKVINKAVKANETSQEYMIAQRTWEQIVKYQTEIEKSQQTKENENEQARIVMQADDLITKYNEQK